MEDGSELVPAMVVANVLHRLLVESCVRWVGERGLFDVLPRVVGTDRLRIITEFVEIIEASKGPYVSSASMIGTMTGSLSTAGTPRTY
ncbi:hypothetical protein [Sinomonas terrae]|uniref:Uncharacterized protein n=1 Tax=Sinomonas terrae TaxID=2908838 RepID=A0ABS9U1Y5_9MICC|nr:hypothetical protein [Sinomonas terrae]MCH6470703.1 hypothetical protein [Sinomonas terrae]